MDARRTDVCGLLGYCCPDKGRAAVSSPEQLREHEPLVRRFIRRHYAPLLLNPMVKVLVLVTFGGMAACAALRLPELGQGLSVTEWLPDDSYLLDFFRTQDELFARTVKASLTMCPFGFNPNSEWLVACGTGGLSAAFRPFLAQGADPSDVDFIFDLRDSFATAGIGDTALRAALFTSYDAVVAHPLALPPVAFFLHSFVAHCESGSAVASGCGADSLALWLSQPENAAWRKSVAFDASTSEVSFCRFSAEFATPSEPALQIAMMDSSREAVKAGLEAHGVAAAAYSPNYLWFERDKFMQVPFVSA
eukprot:SAG11_NODE_5453_length_1555_cov_1.385989_1_plen_305_part_10